MIKPIAMEYEGLLDKQPALYTDEDSPGLRFAGPPSLHLRWKEGFENPWTFFAIPLYARSGERGDKRSDVGVSRLAAMRYQNNIAKKIPLV
jgi:hypothetical protein